MPVFKVVQAKPARLQISSQNGKFYDTTKPAAARKSAYLGQTDKGGHNDLPELKTLQQDVSEIKGILSLTNKRLDDVNTHSVDQSRRIDETNKRLDRLYEVIVRRKEHEPLSVRVQRLEEAMANLEKRIAA